MKRKLIFAALIITLLTLSVLQAQPTVPNRDIADTGNPNMGPRAKSAARVIHNTTLEGDGTLASPLGVSSPLTLTGSLDDENGSILQVANFGLAGQALVATTEGDSAIIAGGGITGVSAQGSTFGVVGFSQNGFGLYGVSIDGFAGRFDGSVHVNGSLSKGGGSFKIDHPLDPENKYLYHSFVESPDMKNIYDGVTSLDSNGEAVVELPEWFEALNSGFRYLLTPIGEPAPGLYVAEKIRNNRFRIGGGPRGLEVSWQITGIRRDAWANKHRIQVEEVKPEHERGLYLHPEAHGQPVEKGLERAHRAEMLKQLKPVDQRRR